MTVTVDPPMVYDEGDWTVCQYCEGLGDCPATDGRFYCIRDNGHEGPHVACGIHVHAGHVWEDEVHD